MCSKLICVTLSETQQTPIRSTKAPVNTQKLFCIKRMKEQSLSETEDCGNKTGCICSLSLENQPSSTGISTTRGSCMLSTTLILFPSGKHHLYQYKTDFSAPLMLCKLKRNSLKLYSCKHTSFVTVIPSILFPIFRAVRFNISKQSPISFIQHYKLQ